MGEEERACSLTSVEYPQRDELDLDDGRDDTHPTSAERGREENVNIPEMKKCTNTHIAKSLYCKSLTLCPNCNHERDRINEITAWIKTLVYT